MTPDTLTAHVPTPEFRAQLEWEVARAFRREARAGVRRDDGRRRWLRAAAIVGISVAIGTASGLASAQVRDVARRDSLLDAARADLTLTAFRLELARAQVADAARRAQVGAIGPEGVAAAEAQLRVMESRVARAQLNIAEIQAASQAPRDELTAPLVGNRDFVTERIRFDVRDTQQRLVAAEQAAAEADKRVRIGVANELTRAEAQLELERARGALMMLSQRLSLRREFIDKGTSADRLAQRLDAIQVREDAHIGQQAYELSKARLQAVERQRAAGAADELEVMRAQVDVKERELELSRLAAQLKRIQARRDSVP